jgi:zinc transport system substrate-binding protein
MRIVPMKKIGALLVVGVLAVGACSDDGGPASGRVRVAASFYPIAWAAEQVGGPDVDVDSLTKAGAEPHDLELTPREVGAVADSDLVLYVHGFQPSVDDAVGEAPKGHVLDLAGAADLDLTFTPIEEGAAHEDEAGSVDPHFWLDPTRLASVAEAIGRRFAEIDPDHADGYAERTRALVARLDRLDASLRQGLTGCSSTTIVTSHNAFGYLARRYGLTQMGITGLTPEDEPSPADLAAVTSFVREHRVGTIFFEALVSPDLARTVASETGARTEVLDPLESISDESQGHDYLEVMASNLRNLRSALGCP